jgi:thiol:disulfide interchange protein DsbC
MKTWVLLLWIVVIGIVRSAAAEEIDFNKALVIGSGSKTVVEFTDPDCPYCRKASKYFDKRTDVTRYIFFFPLQRHPMAKEKARYILSQQDKARAYHEVMSGKLDSLHTLAATLKGTKLLEEQQEIVKKAKVNTTPTFMINGRIIIGFEQEKIEEALGR